MYLESKKKFPILYFDATGGLFNKISEQRNEPFLFPLGDRNIYFKNIYIYQSNLLICKFNFSFS